MIVVEKEHNVRPVWHITNTFQSYSCQITTHTESCSKSVQILNCCPVCRIVKTTKLFLKKEKILLARKERSREGGGASEKKEKERERELLTCSLDRSGLGFLGGVRQSSHNGDGLWWEEPWVSDIIVDNRIKHFLLILTRERRLQGSKCKKPWPTLNNISVNFLIGCSSWYW